MMVEPDFLNDNFLFNISIMVFNFFEAVILMLSYDLLELIILTQIYVAGMQVFLPDIDELLSYFGLLLKVFKLVVQISTYS
jgi:hypothetical protein